MIDTAKSLFHLHTEFYSCLLRINDYGLPELLHFGAPLSPADAEALCCKPGLGWGSGVRLSEDDGASCPDILPLVWSGSGRGDYRETPLDIGRSADLRYLDHKVHRGAVPMITSLPQPHGAGETLELRLGQNNLELSLYFTVFDTALTRRTVLRNPGPEPVTLHKCMSTMLDLPGDYEMTTFNGSWIAEMRRSVIPITASRVVSETTVGLSSARTNPGFLLSEPGTTELSGRVYGFNLIYSGNHYASAQRSFQGLTRVMQGVSPDNFSKVLQPGDCFETPEAVLCFSDSGFEGLSQRMHSFVNHHVIPAYWDGRPRPVLYNDWEGCMFDFNHSRLMGLAKEAQKVGCELFVLDDGWFGDRNTDTAGLGDYNVNKKKLPRGLEGLAADLKKLGLDFGLWVEPECVNPDSDLYRAHPDWALTDEFEPILCRHQLMLDLTKQEVRDYLTEQLCHLLDTVEISYIKWDMNRNSIALGAKAHDYVLGLYEVMHRVFDPRPEVLLENCASGGNRFDLGVLSFGPQVWCSDDTDPIERLTIQEGLSYLYPQSTFGAHVSAAPHGQTLRQTPLATRGNVAFFGCLGYELDWKHLLAIEKDQIAEQISFYKQYRSLFQYGQFRRLENGWQVSDGTNAIAGVFRKLVPAAPGYERLRLRGLKPGQLYSFTTRETVLRLGSFGSLLRHVVPVNPDPNGLILRAADARITVPDGAQFLTATGAGLMAGVQLLPLFRGTGYDRQQRTLMDFGSEIYVVQELSD